MKIYLIANCIGWMFLFLIWKKSDWYNFFLKFVMLVMMLASCFYTLTAFGFVLKK